MGASREKSQEVEWIRAEKLKSGLQRCVLMAAVALGLEKPQCCTGEWPLEKEKLRGERGAVWLEGIKGP